jgi:serine protease Do
VLGDVIVAIDGQSVKTSNDLYRILERYRVNDAVRVDVIRDGRRRTLTVKLQDVRPTP